ncbi:MAG TPA: 4-hydroxythreonine-4-phosphate dehydrogenase PdxA [Geminicoccaceae bacterium]|nr:4-hydroxythreonine-4-phosphate dehydrogenase PdxA [Geminicoccaceae bacterium]
MTTPRIAITMGDPAGIGPEIIAKAVRRLAPRLEAGELTVLVVGTESCMAEATDRLGLPRLPRVEDGPLPPVGLLEAAAAEAPIQLGAVSAEAGRLAYRAIEAAAKLAMSGEVGAIVTAPLNKEALNLAGHAYAGHTELLADLTGARDSVLMLVHDQLRVSHVTAHCALADVPRRATPARLRRVVELTHDALRRMGFERPRIGVAALNPHAGEGGLFGREDIEVTAPVVAACRDEDGFDVEGPVPADTVFVKARAGRYDGVVAMYHDQGHIAVKLLGFSVDPATGRWTEVSGVNVTLGLPIVRTSVDHGTAFDIAGRGIASEASLIDAIEVALRLAPPSPAPDHPAARGGAGRLTAA